MKFINNSKCKVGYWFGEYILNNIRVIKFSYLFNLYAMDISIIDSKYEEYIVIGIRYTLMLRHTNVYPIFLHTSII